MAKVALSFHDLRHANIRRDAEWDPSNTVTPAYRGVELAGEVGEACNIIKKLERARLGIVGSRSSETELAQELADVLICVDLIAMDYGLDLSDALLHKFNQTSLKYGLQTRIHNKPTPGFTYLASPYSHPDPAVREERYRLAVQAAAELSKAGRLVYSPIASWHHASCVHNLPGDFDYWERLDLCMIGKAEDVLVLQIDGWAQSIGIAKELDYSRSLGLPIAFYELGN